MKGVPQFTFGKHRLPGRTPHQARSGPLQKDQSEGNHSAGQREFVSRRTFQTVFPVHFGNGNGHVDSYRQGSQAGQQSGDQKDAAAEFRSRRQVPHPPGNSQIVEHSYELRHPPKHFHGAMRSHDDPQHQPKPQQRQGMKSVKEFHIRLRYPASFSPIGLLQARAIAQRNLIRKLSRRGEYKARASVLCVYLVWVHRIREGYGRSGTT